MGQTEVILMMALVVVMTMVVALILLAPGITMTGMVAGFQALKSISGARDGGAESHGGNSMAAIKVVAGAASENARVLCDAWDTQQQ